MIPKQKSCANCGQTFVYFLGLIFIVISGFYFAGYPPLGGDNNFAYAGWLLKWVGFIAVVNLFWIVMVYVK